jgi:hypothetical protein
MSKPRPDLRSILPARPSALRRYVGARAYGRARIEHLFRQPKLSYNRTHDGLALRIRGA